MQVTENLNIKDYIEYEFINQKEKQDIQRIDKDTSNNFFEDYIEKLTLKAKEAFEKEFTKLSHAEQNFLDTIYSYGSLTNFLPKQIEAYEESGNYVLNYLSHIPRDFHILLYEENQALFDDVKFSEIENVVEEKFIELNSRVMNAFLEKLDEIFDKETIFCPDNIDDYERIKETYFDESTIDYTKLFKYALKNDEIELIQKNELLKIFLRSEVYGDLISNDYPQQAYDENSIIFDTPLLEKFALTAKDKLEELGYKVAIFKDLQESNRYDTYCAFVYAGDDKSFKEVCEYMSEKECYEQIYNSNENMQEQENVQTQKIRRR